MRIRMSARHVSLATIGASAALAVVLLALWESLSRAGALSATCFPPPTRIAMALTQLLTEGDLLLSVGATLQRLILGFVLGGGAGLALGLAMGWSGVLRAVLDPFVAAAHPIPKIAILPLLLILFGLGETPKVVLAALGAFFPVLINSMVGVRQISAIHFEVARNYSAGPVKMLTRVILPGSLPMILAGARIGLNTALLLTIAAELVSARTGLGAAIWLAWETLRSADLYACLLVVALLGIGFNKALQWAASVLTPWREEYDR